MGSLDHRLFLYRAPGDYVSSVLPFIIEGLGRGESVVVLTTSTNIDALQARLRGESSRVSFVDAQKWYERPAQMLRDLHRHVEEEWAGGVRGFRAVGEAVWTNRTSWEVSEWMRYEAIINVALAGKGASILCAYDSSQASREVLADARRTHPMSADGDDSQDYVEPAKFLHRLDAEPLSSVPNGAVELAASRELREVREFVVRYAREAGLHPERVHDVTLAVNEVVTNAEVHGKGIAAVWTWTERGRVIFEVRDQGEGIRDPYAGFIPPRAEEPGGRGLWLVRQLCDRVDVRNRAEGAALRLQVSLA